MFTRLTGGLLFVDSAKSQSFLVRRVIVGLSCNAIAREQQSLKLIMGTCRQRKIIKLILGTCRQRKIIRCYLIALRN